MWQKSLHVIRAGFQHNMCATFKGHGKISEYVYVYHTTHVLPYVVQLRYYVALLKQCNWNQASCIAQ